MNSNVRYNKDIVNQIESGKLTDAKDSIQQASNRSFAEIVDMKRVEMSVDWQMKKT